MYLVSTLTSDRQKWYTGPGRDVCSVMWHHAGRDSKGMGTKLYVRGACFEEFDRIQSRNHGRLMCVMYLVSTFTSDTPDISCARLARDRRETKL